MIKFVSYSKPFGLRTYIKGDNHKSNNSIKLYANKHIGYIKKDKVKTNLKWIEKHKVFITYAYGGGSGSFNSVINRPIYGEPGSCCTETYLVIGPFHSKQICLNVMSYMKTRFFRFLVLLIKNTQHANRSVYQFVPIQNFDEQWTDEKLYKKYGLTQEEINYIEKLVKPIK